MLRMLDSSSSNDNINEIKYCYLNVIKHSKRNIIDNSLNLLYDRQLYKEIFMMNKQFTMIDEKKLSILSKDENFKENYEDSCIVCYNDDKDNLGMTKCCKGMICLGCAIEIKKRNNRCPKCRHLDFSLEVINLKKRTFYKYKHSDLSKLYKDKCVDIESPDYNAMNCKVYNYMDMLKKILFNVLSNHPFTKIMIVYKTLNYHIIPKFQTFLNTNKMTNIYNFKNSNIVKIKKQINEYNTFGGIILINTHNLLNILPYIIKTDLVINVKYDSYYFNNLVPYKLTEIFCMNKKTTIYDLVGNLDNTN